jgi:hypothetical protein
MPMTRYNAFFGSDFIPLSGKIKPQGRASRRCQTGSGRQLSPLPANRSACERALASQNRMSFLRGRCIAPSCPTWVNNNKTHIEHNESALTLIADADIRRARTGRIRRGNQVARLSFVSFFFCRCGARFDSPFMLIGL